MLTFYKNIVAILFCILAINFVKMYYRNLLPISYNNYFLLKIKKIIYYSSKYRNCYNHSNPLICGHKYEGYKKQKKGIYPTNIIANLSLYKTIKAIGYIRCEKNEIVIGVVCAPHHVMERMSLRMGYEIYKNKLLLFFTGLSENEIHNKRLLEENKIYNDIIIFNFISHYFNSSLLMILEINWIVSYCKGFKYLIYHTPDVFLNYYVFYEHYIKNKRILHPIIAEKLIKNRVLRSNRSRFYIPYSVYNRSYFPPQPNGPLIAISNETLKKLLECIEHVKLSIWMDDVYLSFLLHKAKIKIHNLNNVISRYPVQIKTLPNISFIITKITYIHSLPPGAIYYLLYSCSNYYFKNQYHFS